MEEAVLEENHQKEIASEVFQDLFTMYTCFNIQSKIKNPFIYPVTIGATAVISVIYAL